MNEHAPGWYEHHGERRYWDGSQWTHSTSLPPTPSDPPSGAMPPAPTGNAVSPYTPPPAYGTPGAYGPPPGAIPPPMGMPAARKEPALALLVSFLIPGVGSMINGDVGPGVAFLLAYAFGWLLIVGLGWILIGLVGVPICLGAWIWSMVHAYQGAVDHNRAIGYAG